MIQVLSLKPSAGMSNMKTDMGGAATVIGAMCALSRMKVKKNIVTVIAACENSIGGNAYRPGDIIGSMGGKTIEVDNAECLKVGFTIRLFKDGPEVMGNPTAGSYLPDDVNIIESIVGNTVTFTNDFISVLGTDIVLKMADYDLASEEQKARYAFIGENAGFFNDGSKSYQIIF